LDVLGQKQGVFWGFLRGDFQECARAHFAYLAYLDTGILYGLRANRAGEEYHNGGSVAQSQRRGCQTTEDVASIGQEPWSAIGRVCKNIFLRYFFCNGGIV